ncbi:MAG: ligase-associated DNA damage response exonuclease [Bacteroidia bacterium]
MNLIEFTDKGLYCAPGDFYIDPWKPVKRALITHAHGDHARWGHRYYLSHHDSIPIMQVRLGNNNYDGVEFGETRDVNGVKVSFHPAGHIIGSAQIRLEYKGEIWVASGDYKTESDGFSPDFEPVKCHAFITESTFGLPIYNWQPQENIFNDINIWWKSNQERGMATVLCGYSLGKAQRILMNLDRSIGDIYLHGSIYNLHKALIEKGIQIPYYPKVDVTSKRDIYHKAMIIAPPSATGSAWLKRFTPYSLGVASGWMALRGAKRRKAADKGFILSDHADWNGLNWAVEATGAERVFVTHGYTSQFSAWLRGKGLDAKPVETLFEDGTDELNEGEHIVEESASNIAVDSVNDDIVEEVK